MGGNPLRWTLSIALCAACCLALASPASARGGVSVGAGGGGRPGAGIEVTRGEPRPGALGPSCRSGAVGVACAVSPFVGLGAGAILFAWLASRGPHLPPRPTPRRRRGRRRAPPPHHRRG